MDGELYCVNQLSYIRLTASVSSGSLLTFVHTNKFHRFVHKFSCVGGIIFHVCVYCVCILPIVSKLIALS
ncbi:MAG: hypothetical protein WCG25_04345 [bacterium]